MNKTKTTYSSHVSSQSTQNENALLRTSHTSIVQIGRKLTIIPANLKQTFPMVAMFVFQSGPNEETLYRTFHRCFLPNLN